MRYPPPGSSHQRIEHEHEHEHEQEHEQGVAWVPRPVPDLHDPTPRPTLTRQRWGINRRLGYSFR